MISAPVQAAAARAGGCRVDAAQALVRTLKGDGARILMGVSDYESGLPCASTSL
ncbi:hypothetical protein GCM10020367_25730 [Streptomyces sannanensis]|uniref:Uncharacterized protein n=1 Tax=Streptomyces sannanensis TaxID=285536 RepID=A0ABP6SAU4_9ACTN